MHKDLFRMVSYYYIVLYIEYDKKSRKVIFNLSILFSKKGNRKICNDKCSSKVAPKKAYL